MTRAGSESIHGPQWRWAEVFLAHHAAFFTYALHFETGVHDAEDLVQTALLRLAQRARPDRDAIAYAMAAIRNLALDRRRRRMVRPADHSTHGKHLLFLAADDGEARLTTALALDDDESARLRAAFDALDEARREVVLLKVFGELSLRQIAAVLDQPLGTVASTYRRALTEIRERLQWECQNHGPTHARRSRC